MQDKKVLVRANAFSILLIFYGIEYEPKQENANLSIIKNSVCKTLLCQSIKKVIRTNMYNFQIFCVL